MRWNRWAKRVLAGLLALGPSTGCKQQLFLEPGDYRDAVLNTLPKGLENNPHDTIVPDTVERMGNGPGTVLDPDRPARMVTLKECIAIALEQGNVGGQSSSNFGFKSDGDPQFSGRGVDGSDAIRVFAVAPAIANAELERSLSKFDARWISSMQWQKLDQPIAAQFLSFQNSRDTANFATTLAKPLPTGGVAGITFSTDYSKFSNIPPAQQASFVNPNYTPRLQFSFEQPLMRLFGVEVNQLAASHPGSQLINGFQSTGAGTEGILIARIRLDQSKATFDTRVNYMLVNVETAYWNLYSSYYNLYAQEEGMRQSFDGFRFTQLRVEAGTQDPQDLDQARAQFERFRRQVFQARGQVLESERALRGLMGLRSDDGTRLIPIDEPNLAPFAPDFYEAANEAVANRPELLLIRQELKASQLILLLQKNLRRPDLRTFGTYDVAGLGTRLDGREFSDSAGLIPGNALTSLGNDSFNSWTLGFRLDMPLGFRDANAQVRQAQLNLARSYYQLRDAEMKALEYVVNQYRRLVQAHAEIGPAQAERLYLQRYLYKAKTKIDIGRWTTADFQQYLTVQRDLATAIGQEFRAIADYNSALAAFEFAKGTVQRYNNVSVGEGPLPPWVTRKAADHIRERTEAALKLRERDISPAPGGPGIVGGMSVGPPTGSGIIGNLPPFAEKREPLPDALPEPKSVDPKSGEPKKDKLPKLPDEVKMGARPFSNPPLREMPAAPAPNLTLPETNAGDYFQPTGTVTFPARVNGGRGGYVAPVGPAPTAPAPLPAGSRGGAAPLPLPLGGDVTLPVPPAAPGTELPTPVPTAPGGSGAIEFGPAGSVTPIPTPPESRYPIGR